MVFPISDDNSDRASFPVVNIFLIVLNVLVFVLFQQFGQNDAFVQKFSTVPKEIITGKDIVTADQEVQVSTERGPVIVRQPGLLATPIPVYLTILTSMFMHANFMHIAGNMLFLWIFGDNVEDDMGRIRYVIFYLLCGIIASLAHVFTNINSDIPSLGASGAISGVMGAYLVLHTHRRVRVFLFRVLTEVPAWVAVGMWFGFQILNSIMAGGKDGVAYGAHIGGFIAGTALAYPFIFGRNRPKKQSPSYGYDPYRR